MAAKAKGGRLPIVKPAEAGEVSYGEKGMAPDLRPYSERNMLERKILEYMGWGHPLATILEGLGVTFMEYVRWKAKDKRFAVEMGKLELARKELVADSLFVQAAGGTDPVSKIFFLTNDDPDTWKDRRAGAGGGGSKPIQIQVISGVDRPAVPEVKGAGSNHVQITEGPAITPSEDPTPG